MSLSKYLLLETVIGRINSKMKLVVIVIRKVVCFAKHDDDMLTKMAAKVSAAMVEQIADSNKLAMDSILDRLDKMNLKG